MAEELRVVATAGNETEAEMIGEWLSEAGIRSMPQMSSRGIRLGAAAERDIYVEAKDYDRALEVINGEAPSEAELAALSEAAATQQSQPKGTNRAGEPNEPLEIPVPKAGDWERALDQATGPKSPPEDDPAP
jgi:Putative prokaryotic signal transducing protein